MNDNKELIKYLDGKFSGIDNRFEDVDAWSKTATDQFIRMEGRFEKLEAILENKADKSDVNNLTNAIDALVKSIEDLKMEYSAVTVAINRHETWLKQIADKVGIKLEY